MLFHSVARLTGPPRQRKPLPGRHLCVEQTLFVNGKIVAFGPGMLCIQRYPLASTVVVHDNLHEIGVVRGQVPAKCLDRHNPDPHNGQLAKPRTEIGSLCL